MPAIQVYKSGATMIPVDNAKKAKAYICPWTGDLYATKRSYVSHLKRLRTDRMHRRARQLRHQRRLEDMWGQPDFNSVIRWIHLHPEVFWENAKRRGWHSDGSRWDKIRDTFEVKITHLRLTYSDHVSNSHSCPHNGVTNWGGDKKLKDGTPAPRGYPGFSGSIGLHIPVEPLSFASNVFEGTGIHTGGGGGGSGYYRYEVKFFLDDWPGIAERIRAERERYERDNLINMIKNEYKPFKIADFSYGKER